MRPYLKPKAESKEVELPDIICGSLVVEEEWPGVDVEETEL